MSRTKKVVPGDPKKAVAYVRVSKSKQTLSSDAQAEQIKLWAAKEGVTIVAWCNEGKGVESTTPIEKRPALDEAWASILEHGAGILVVAKRDRIAREIFLTITVERRAELLGAMLMSASGEGNGDSPGDALMRSVFDAVAAFEKATIKARTRAALAVKKKRGEKCGGREAPYGQDFYDGDERLRKDGTVSPVRMLRDNPSEQAIISEAAALRASGLSLRAISQTLLSQGKTQRNGKPFEAMAIARMLASTPVQLDQAAE